MASIVFVLLISNTMLVFMLTQKREVVHLLPPKIDKELTLSKIGFSETYLEEMSFFFANLLLNVESDRVEKEHEFLLNYVDSANYHDVKKQLKIEQDKYKEMDLVTKFRPEKIERIKDSLMVRVSGTLDSYISGERFSKDAQTVIFQFSYDYGRLFIEKIILE